MQKRPQKPQTNKRAVTIRGVSRSFSGPIPPPQILEQYDLILPGAAERILKMAEDQSSHRRSLEKQIVQAEIRQVRLGQILGFIIAIFGLTVSALIAIFGSAVAGGIIGIGTLASLVGVFMYGSKTRAEQEKDDNDE